jgi:hypothetical protein
VEADIWSARMTALLHESMIVRRMLALEARLEVAAVGGAAKAPWLLAPRELGDADELMGPGRNLRCTVARAGRRYRVCGRLSRGGRSVRSYAARRLAGGRLVGVCHLIL